MSRLFFSCLCFLSVFLCWHVALVPVAHPTAFRQWYTRGRGGCIRHRARRGVGPGGEPIQKYPPPHTTPLRPGTRGAATARGALGWYRPSVGVPRDVGCCALVVFVAYIFSVQFRLHTVGAGGRRQAVDAEVEVYTSRLRGAHRANPWGRSCSQFTIGMEL